MLALAHRKSNLLLAWSSAGPQSFVASGSGTDQDAELGTFTIPKGTMRENSILLVQGNFSYNNSAATKNLKIKWHGTLLCTTAPTTSVTSSLQGQVWNNGVKTAQRAYNATGWSTQNNANALRSGAGWDIDTDAVDVIVTLTAAWGTASVTSETITLSKWFALLIL